MSENRPGRHLDPSERLKYEEEIANIESEAEVRRSRRREYAAERPPVKVPARAETRQAHVRHAGTPSRRPQRRRQRLSPALSYIVLAVTLMAMVGFVVVMAATKMLPGKYLIAVCVLLAVLFFIIAALIWKARRRGSFWFGTVCAAILVAMLAVGCHAGIKGISTLQTLTKPNTAVSHIGVYVLQEDPAQSLIELIDTPFGIIQAMDRTTVDNAIASINEQLGLEIQTQELPGPMQVINALLDGSLRAIIINAAYMDNMDEIEQYGDLSSRVREIDRIRVETDRGVLGTVDINADEPFTVYISGIDSRNGLVAESLSDVNIIATVNPQTHQVLLLSTPRDTFVPLSVSGGERDKLTHAGWYGIDVCVDTMEMLYDIELDYYFRICFDGFKEIVDAVGGVTVNSEISFESRLHHYYYSEGENFLDGEHALEFARERKAFSDGDHQRGRNQMKLIKALAEKILSPELLTNYASLMDAAVGNFETTVPYELVAALVRNQLDDGGSWDIVSYSLAGSGDYQVPYSLDIEAYVMWADEDSLETAKTLMRQVLDGEIVTVP